MLVIILRFFRRYFRFFGFFNHSKIVMALPISTNKSDDLVQCVPTKKGHQILYKGYTYVFRSKLQCGAEQWSCSYRQKTEELPEWVSIYYAKVKQNEMRCNICEIILAADEKDADLLEHIKLHHKEVHDLHKENPEATVGFHIEFLHLNELKDDIDQKSHPVIIGEVCETATEDLAKPLTESEDYNIENQIIVTPLKKKARRESETRRKSWVWKYFDRISNVIYRCTLCDSVLSIKGCNTNNMNRHVRTKHPNVFQAEMSEKKVHLELDSTVEIDQSLVKDEICTPEMFVFETRAQKQLQRRSWIWQYFDRMTNTLAQCKICQRNICHGGNATGNMNRHLKMIHNKTGPENNNWVWKVFDRSEDDFYSCKICQYRCSKSGDMEKNIASILHHLKCEHGVVSGEQIITSTECEDED